MSDKQKIIFKQFALSFSVLLFYPLLWLINFDYSEFDSIFYNIFDIPAYLVACFYAPLLLLFLYNLKKEENLEKLNRIFRIVSWVFLSFTALLFLGAIYDELFFTFEDMSAIKVMYHLIRARLEWGYITDIEFGMMYDLKVFLRYSPLIITSALLYWSIRVNRKLLLNKNDEQENK